MTTDKYQKNPVKQLKFVNGDEVLCEVVDWGDYSEDENDNAILEILVRHCLQITFIDSNDKTTMTNSSIFAFKPWMAYQETFDNFISLNPQSIVAVYSPGPQLVEQYVQSINEIYEFFTENEAIYKMKRKDAKEIDPDAYAYVGSMSDDNDNELVDSDRKNIIRLFPENDTTH